jgi:exoribonuclease-2
VTAQKVAKSRLENLVDIPDVIAKVTGLKEALECQHKAARLLLKRRQHLGALNLSPSHVEVRVIDGVATLIDTPAVNAARQLIENLMIAANHILAKSCKAADIPSLRRIVRQPKNWARIVKLAADVGESLPATPDAPALERFLSKRHKIDPAGFPELSLAILKLIGRGEYSVELPNQPPIGHFGLALGEYTHSTAPNRRLPDLITQRQYKHYLQHQPAVYTVEELQYLAEHCTKQADVINKLERRMNKSAAALLLSSELGSVFKGVVTGASDKGTWVRVFQPPVEGKVVQGMHGLEVGDQVTVKLVSVDVLQGFIDFIREE